MWKARPFFYQWDERGSQFRNAVRHHVHASRNIDVILKGMYDQNRIQGKDGWSDTFMPGTFFNLDPDITKRWGEYTEEEAGPVMEKMINDESKLFSIKLRKLKQGWAFKVTPRPEYKRTVRLMDI